MSVPELYCTREFLEQAHPAFVQRKWRTVRIMGVPYRMVRKWYRPKTYVLIHVWDGSVLDLVQP